jgi:hypothetical protein
MYRQIKDETAKNQKIPAGDVLKNDGERTVLSKRSL